MIVVGCGYTGARLARAERDAGRESVGVVASADSLARLDALGIDGARWDLDGEEGAPALAWDTTVVYLVPPPRQGDTDPRLARFLDRLPAPPRRLVYASTTGVYGNRDGARVDERTPPRPQTDRARRRVAAERLLHEWCAAREVPWVVLRVPGIYGPGRLQQNTVEAGRAMLHPDEAGPGNRIHVDDLVRCLQAAASTTHTNRVYNVGDGNPMSNTEFVTLVARHLGRPAPPRAGRAEVEAAASPMARSFLRESREVDVTDMQQVLGVTPRYGDPAEGIAASLRRG